VKSTSSARLILVCGLPASGKTTLARELARETAAIRLNADDWMTQLGHDVWDDAFRGVLEARLWALTRELLARGQSVILEWGHWARSERDEKRLGARALGVAVELHYLEVPLEVLIARVERRNAGEWTAAPITRAHMELWAANFQAPDEEELRLFDAPVRQAGGISAPSATSEGPSGAVTITIVISGVAGSGKSTILALLTARLGWPAAEGDRFHSPENVAKMTAGVPLTDADRWPWLRAIASWIGDQEAAGSNALVTCSALRRAYRDLLRAGHPSVRFAELVAPEAVLARRMEQRVGHYMPESLLASQLDTLEPLGPDEPGFTVDATLPPEQIADEILARLPEVRPG
jgi:gluconokinase